MEALQLPSAIHVLNIGTAFTSVFLKISTLWKKNDFFDSFKFSDIQNSTELEVLEIY